MSDTPFFDEVNEVHETFPAELETVDDPSKTPKPKVIAATGGAAVGGALALLTAWILGMFGVDVPGEVQGAFTVLFSTALAFVGGYWAAE